jgi:hypothetical protein
MKSNTKLVNSLIGKEVMYSHKDRAGNLNAKKYTITEIKESRYMAMGFDLVMQPETVTWEVKIVETKPTGKYVSKRGIELGHNVPLLKENVLKAFKRNNAALIEGNKITIIV